MDYHKELFHDHSLMIFRNDEIVGVFPAAVSNNNLNYIISHPGLTFGGLISGTKGSQDHTQSCLSKILEYYKSQNFERLIYKAIPSIYQSRPAEQDQYFLWRSGFECFRTDLSVSINLSNKIELSSRRRRGLKISKKALSLTNDITFIDAFWTLLTNNLYERHSVQPTHSIDEIKKLMLNFPNNIVPIFALRDNNCVGGVVLYKTPNAHHAQYISANREGQDLGALDLIFDTLIHQARDEKVAFFDFGISTEESGMKLNEGLYSFKYQFGGGGTCHRFYSKEL
jgi:hypothetical protein